MQPPSDLDPSRPATLIEHLVRFCIRNKLPVFVVVLLMVAGGLLVAPFDWDVGGALRNPVPADAIPDIGEKQQIVFTDWPGRSPQDVEDQISYPLTVALLGLPSVKSVRSFSMFGFSSIYVIFQDDVDFYWSRTRILEKLNSLPAETLPPGVQPLLGPDATAMGQVFWYTLEGRDDQGQPTGGWDLNELRTIQDWYVRLALTGVDGVSEVASVGGFVQEYQVDIDPDRMRAFGVSLYDVLGAIRQANLDVGAQTIEVNRVEYLIRGLGFFKGLEDIENSLIKINAGVPVLVKTVANVVMGPASRQGALDKGGAEAVGGVVVVRYGENPLAVIQKVKRKIEMISPGLPRRTLADGSLSQVTIVPYYDRTELIQETLGTLEKALISETLVTIVVVIVILLDLGSSLVVASMLPLAVLFAFIAMRIFGVEANIVALSGIAIALGTIVDMGIILTENIHRRLAAATPSPGRLTLLMSASRDVGGAMLTAVGTTIIGFLPIFSLTGAEGKLFRPLAFTKTFTLSASLILALVVIPPLMHTLMKFRQNPRGKRWIFYEGLVYLGVLTMLLVDLSVGSVLAILGIYYLLDRWMPQTHRKQALLLVKFVLVTVLILILTAHWAPLGAEKGGWRNFLFTVGLVGGILGLFLVFYHRYRSILQWCLAHKSAFLALPAALLFWGGMVWLGTDFLWGWVPRLVKQSSSYQLVQQRFPGLGKEFMPPLDEGSFLLMPSTMPHASIGEVLDILHKQDRAIQAIPEVETAVGKLGRAQTPLDPAPLSMIETLIIYHPQYLQDENNEVLRFQHEADETDWMRDPAGNPLPALDGQPYRVRGRYIRDERGRLIPDPKGQPFRLWRPAVDSSLNPGRDPWSGIGSAADIWDVITQAARMPGTTTAARLQPISARMVMLQSGIRASMGVKVFGPDLPTIQEASLQIERFLRQVPSIRPQTVIADRVIGKPYIEIEVDRQAIAQYGIRLQTVMDVIEFAIGGRQVTTTVEGRERYPVRVRYIRELRDDLESLGGVLVPLPDGSQLPLRQLADIAYVKGPQVIKGEDTFLIGYVLFDGHAGAAETSVVDDADAYLKDKLATGAMSLPAGVSYAFTGTYENQVRSEKRLQVILPATLVIIFLILYMQFKSTLVTGIVFSGIAVAWSGGFALLWLYAQPWFLDFSVFGTAMRDLFQVHPIHLSVAVWVGFLALFGIASDDGVVMATYLEDQFAAKQPQSMTEIRDMVIASGLRRVRPCVMTTATTLLALIPVLTSTGRGSDIMVPMAIPAFGGMLFEVMTMLVVPVLYCWRKESEFSRRTGSKAV
ncbi:efflux RND transporter permease subunit [Desulfosarcina sp.]|uniref:efflux RND transporter permease subunit n=1 Tax=Desulfosarcina sp. TaxID=2027861 RepID=UPI003970C6C6